MNTEILLKCLSVYNENCTEEYIRHTATEIWVAFLEGSDTFHQKVSNMKIIYSMQKLYRLRDSEDTTQHSAFVYIHDDVREQITSQSVSDS